MVERVNRETFERLNNLTLELGDALGVAQSMASTASTAAGSTYDNSTSGLAATSVQAAIDEIADPADVYTITNDSPDRALDCNAVAGAISATYVQSEIENIRDKMLELADVVGTLAKDLQDRGIIG